MSDNKIHSEVEKEMASQWDIKLSKAPFISGNKMNIPSLGYLCAHCAGKKTKINFAASTNEDESNLEWMELICRKCNYYTLYTRK